MTTHYDIIVAGGGFAGTAAAISAARQHKRVLLFDSSNCLGGAAANNLITPFMPNQTRLNGAVKKLSGGIFQEIEQKLNEFQILTKERNFSFNEEHLKIILNRMVLKENITLLFHATLIHVEQKDQKITGVTLASKSGDLHFTADYFIDATGDADLAFRAGCSLRLGREADQLCQPMTLCFRLSNVDMEAYEKEYSAIQALYRQYQKDGLILNPREDILTFHVPQQNVLHFNSTRIVRRNPVDPFQLTQAEIEAREQVLELYLFLKENFSAFRNSELLSTAAQIGVRESRMISGHHLLTGKELVACTRFEDSIACGNYDIDIHNPEGSGTSHYYFPEGAYYEIPYRSLIPLEFSNLLVTGRCISVDHEAQASIRIMPIVCCLGEAAGVGAAVAFDAGCAAIDADIQKIQQILTENGAVIH